MKKIIIVISILYSVNIASAQNTGVGTIIPLMKMHVSNTDSAVALFENTETLVNDVSTALYFKTGNTGFAYTGAVKTIGEGTSTARLGFFTFAGNNPNVLKERLSINDNGHVGIGTIHALASLHVEGGNVLFNGPSSLPVTATAPPLSNAGYRMFWYADKAAFRAGGVAGANWNQSNVGNFSVAAGYDNLASGTGAVAMGQSTNATGTSATAFGSSTIASGDYSVAMGLLTTASGYNAVAIGNNSTASGIYSNALGTKVSTNGFRGACIIGDEGSTLLFGPTNCVRNDEFRARFNGGYAFYTNTGTTTGVFMLNGSNSWSSISDSTKKENFKKTDGEHVLNSIVNLRLGSWNYKSQDKKTFRHYGPMAQEFYSAFGNDGIGRIGCDTLIATADMDGIMMIGLQALIKRSDALADENRLLKNDNLALTQTINLAAAKYQDTTDALAAKMLVMENKLNELVAKTTEPSQVNSSSIVK